MKTIFTAAVKTLIRFFPVDFIGDIMAICIAHILNNASCKGGRTWEKAKKTMQKVEIWSNLFNQVYEDDEMDRQEEKIIADAISNLTTIRKIQRILHGETD